MEDTDAPQGHSIHWLVYNIPASATGLVEATPPGGDLPSDTRQGVNDLGKLGYSGPCPRPGATHRYVFKLYTLDYKLPPKARANAGYVGRAMEGHVLAQAQITGVYSASRLGLPNDSAEPGDE
jgi:Raf kinase inhibitor-like YbhB/YbcL family protein